MINKIIAVLTFIVASNAYSNETELTRLKAAANPTENERGVKHCDLSTYNIVGGHAVYEDTIEDEAVVVDHGNSFSINVSIYNVDSPVLMYKADNAEGIVLASRNQELIFERERVIKDKTLEYRLINTLTKRIFVASDCE
ncbi:hypothetical protein EDF81_0068 [Enterobacter sp. BIGb0383]|uniref:hypothetical protein n=1 Tax=unclassified Enterobacter TaxID=2608935 RepID=UPI000F4AF38A|nr:MULTISPECIES: hypothetical protein [unclassified Enterobacter]ROP61597.1 hypothetical protein EDF81_0068 [Enterobacter sp. BIGb0383]ROS11758.1 hypothetical protein EC848_0068 [Enterobacter sp. BIGb0359]